MPGIATQCHVTPVFVKYAEGLPANHSAPFSGGEYIEFEASFCVRSAILCPEAPEGAWTQKLASNSRYTWFWLFSRFFRAFLDPFSFPVDSGLRFLQMILIEFSSAPLCTLGSGPPTPLCELRQACTMGGGRPCNLLDLPPFLSESGKEGG